MTIEMKVHRIIEGPYEDPEEEGIWFVEALIELNGKMSETTLFNTDFDELYELTKHFKRPTLEPYIIEIDEEDVL